MSWQGSCVRHAEAQAKAASPPQLAKRSVRRHISYSSLIMILEGSLYHSKQKGGSRVQARDKLDLSFSVPAPAVPPRIFRLSSFFAPHTPLARHSSSVSDGNLRDRSDSCSFTLPCGVHSQLRNLRHLHPPSPTNGHRPWHGLTSGMSPRRPAAANHTFVRITATQAHGP